MPSEDSNQTVHMHSLIRIFTGHILGNHGYKQLSCDNKGYDLSLCRLHVSEGSFSHVVVHIFGTLHLGSD